MADLWHEWFESDKIKEYNHHLKGDVTKVAKLTHLFDYSL